MGDGLLGESCSRWALTGGGRGARDQPADVSHGCGREDRERLRAAHEGREEARHHLLLCHVARERGTLGAVLNAANEVAVDAFVAGSIPFGGISKAVELTIEKHAPKSDPTLDDLLQADRWARETASTIIGSQCH